MIKLNYLLTFLLIATFISCGKNHDAAIESIGGEFIGKVTNKADLSSSGCTAEKLVGSYSLIKCNEMTSESDLDGVEEVEPNYLWHTMTIEDPHYSKLWGLKNLEAEKAWELSKGSKDIKVMVIDTGIDYNHKDLRDNMWINQEELNGEEGVDDDGNGYIDDIHGYDFANNDPDPFDDQGHGTHCAGTIGAVHNDIGVAGVMAHVTLIPCKFLDKRGSGSTANAIKCIEYGIANNVDIMSNSWGGGGASDALKKAIEKARDAGIIFTAAAGNSASNNDTKPNYPSNYDVENIIAVAANTKYKNLASFSCYGKKTVHIAAPGQTIYSTVPNNKYKNLSGTSMATPHVSGMLGLLLAHEGFTSFKEIKERLMFTGIYNPKYKNALISSADANLNNLLRDIRPERPAEPIPGQWIDKVLDKPIETDHPYANSYEKKWTIKVKEAKFIRLHVEKAELENRYDYIEVLNKQNQAMDKISGEKEDIYSLHVDGDTINIKFKTDRSKTKWGFIITKIQYQI